MYSAMKQEWKELIIYHMRRKSNRMYKKIMDAEVERKKGFKSMDDIYSFEKKYNILLPEEYEEFLLNYGSGYIKADYCYTALENTPLTPESGYQSVDYFYGSDIVGNMDVFLEELNGQLLPIADAGGGDFICIGVKDEYKWKVYYWMHEGKGSVLGDDLYLIANTFGEFIQRFEERSLETEIDLDDVELILDDDLLD